MKREVTKSMKELLPLFIQEMGLGAGLDAARVSELWDQLLGPSITSATQHKRVWEGKLYVKLNSSVVRNYLYIDKINIMSRINDALGKPLITDLILF